MKNLITILFTILSIAGYSQQFDSLLVQKSSVDTSKWVLGYGSYNSNNLLSFNWINSEFTSDELSAKLIEYVDNNEYELSRANRIIYNLASLNEFIRINQILNQPEFGGESLLSRQTAAHGFRFVGYYTAVYNNTTTYLRLLEDGTAVQVEADSTVTPGGYSGTWRATSANNIILQNVYPVAVVPSNLTRFSVVAGRILFSYESELTLIKQ